MPQDKDIDVYDIADWLWSFKWMAAAFLILGLAGSAYMWRAGDAPPSKEIILSVFPGGNVVWSDVQIVEILSATAMESGARVLPSGAASQVVLSVQEAGSEKAVIAVIAEVEGLLLNQTRAWVDEITPLINQNSAAFDSYATARAFLKGLDSGMIKLVAVESREVPRPTSIMRQLLPLGAACGLFLLLACGRSFVVGWRRRKTGQ
ncbi:hypothetical protein JHC09_15900 [Devosia sp. MC532]|uniref:hypothetical protein n=1 Tax=Devosia sp. MC532 TaxID=2799788 RepID=UPI0018F29DEC|nr:hypothetical protein [Devosia sp. MC532]MBJ7579360.1 hypothetical protein [Devosia sp. MC532]